MAPSIPSIPPIPLGLTYDSGALIAADRNDRRMWLLHQRALSRGVRPVVSAACLIEVWRRSTQVNLSRLLDGCEVESVQGDRAQSAGVLLGRAVGSFVGRSLPGPSSVDAVVVECALRRNLAVVTSDRSDIVALAVAAHRKLEVIDI